MHCILIHAGAVSYGYAMFGQGTGAIVIQNTYCQGDELSLISCSSSILYAQNHAVDVGVRCKPGNDNDVTLGP